ncbi:MAG: chemotaxis protein [Pseudomonadota bacterium]
MSESTSATPRQYRFHPLMEGIAVAAVIFSAIMFVSYFIYVRAVEAQEDEIKEGLLRSAGVIQSFIDVDLHRTFRSPESEDTPEYQAQIGPMWKVINAGVQIEFVYTVILGEDGKAYFVLDATPDGDADGDGVEDSVDVMQEYDEIPEDLMEALETQTLIASDKPYTDQWGTFVSAYVPLYDSDGNFEAVLGLDIEKSNYYERLEPIQRATIRAMVAGFFISYMIGSIVWFLRHFAAQLNTSRMRFFDKAGGDAQPAA